MENDEGFLLKKKELGSRQSLVHIYTFESGLNPYFVPTKYLKSLYILDQVEFTFESKPNIELPIIKNIQTQSIAPKPITVLKYTLVSEILSQLLENCANAKVYQIIDEFKTQDSLHFISLIWQVVYLQGIYPEFICTSAPIWQNKYYDYAHHCFRHNSSIHCYDTTEMELISAYFNNTPPKHSKRALELTLDYLEVNLPSFRPIATLKFLHAINI